jgi:predicted DNA-binding transcriptional regulator YafY
VEAAKKIKRIVGNEELLYVAPTDREDIIDKIWELARHIREQTILSISYTFEGGEPKERTLLPVSIYFSEFYFYVISINPNYPEQKNEFKTLRIDRISDIHPTGRHFKPDYKKRFEDGEFRKIANFAYAGKPVKVEFEFYSRPSVPLDRFPESKILRELPDGKGNVFEIQAAENFGLMMWLLSQGENIKVLKPASLVEEMKTTIARMNKLYE